MIFYEIINVTVFWLKPNISIYIPTYSFWKKIIVFSHEHTQKFDWIKGNLSKCREIYLFKVSLILNYFNEKLYLFFFFKFEEIGITHWQKFSCMDFIITDCQRFFSLSWTLNYFNKKWDFQKCAKFSISQSQKFDFNYGNLQKYKFFIYFLT